MVGKTAALRTAGPPDDIVKPKCELTTNVGSNETDQQVLGLCSPGDGIALFCFCRMNNVSLRCEMWAFFEVLIHNPNVTCLDLSCTGLSQHDVQVLSKALKHPACNVRELL